MRQWAIKSTRIAYQSFLKPAFFQQNPEAVHHRITRFGENLGRSQFWKNVIGRLFNASNPKLSQKVAGVVFSNPIGLAAGFDYEARLTQILPFMGFGWQTIGTITALASGGNASPQLGRLPISKSLMVNKGFRNLGITQTLIRLRGLRFVRPVGISIGRTNNPAVATLEASVKDIVTSFREVEKNRVPFSYYELNISCPNLGKGASFYEVKNLRVLLTQLDKLKLSQSVFIKMPITQPNEVVQQLLKEICRHSITGIIIGNVQTDRTVPSLDPGEVAKFKMGNFSGKPTQARSDELIALAYKNFGKKLVIVGCGGVFNAEDAYQKIQLGATLIQMITGLIFEGPQVVTEINLGLLKLLERDGYRNISEAIGTETYSKP
ncbi:MAG TPA: dihydroorotate dehydrogenase (quinone) [Candidatus Saccharimonadales bacterium]|nr:dihydroorotate dehydrogenase (quinone) [Candidatus Saccharimonadales bacterium]